MAWKKLEQRNSIAWKFEEDGELEGEFLGSRKAKSKKGKPITFHEFKHYRSNEVVSVLGGAVLDNTLARVEEGAKVKISYVGMQEGKSGEYKNYEISVWEDE